MISELENKYKSWTAEDVENLLSNFLINSWSYSKVTTFARNEKAFEMQYVYQEKAKSSPTTVAGQAYHVALQNYFESKKEGETLTLPMLEAFAYDYIDEYHPASWKLQKTSPSVEECRKKAFDAVTKLLKNFYCEKSIYEDEIKEILDVELFCNEFLVINGVDIPMPCQMKIDLVVQTNDYKVAVIDHKSKSVFSTDEEMKLGIGIQAITYTKGYESSQGISVDEVWFVENKYSQNKDGSPQLQKFKLTLDDDTRRLYESLLYEPLKAMLEAVNNPDHIYLINDSDNFVDKAEIYAFWAKTMIAEVSDFDIPESKQELIARRLKKTRDASIASVNPNIIKKFRENAASFIQYDLSNTNMTTGEKIEHVLRSFGIVTQVKHHFDGYSSDTYLLDVSAGTKMTSVHQHKLDIASVLGVSNVRIAKDLTVYDGKSYLSIDFSKKREKTLFFNPKALVAERIPLGKDNMDNIIFWDLANQSTPHALICGATGSGKSVEIKCIIENAKLAKCPEIIVFDPKFEFTSYASDKKVSVLNDIEEIEVRMRELVEEMNERVKLGQSKRTLIVFDEFADAVSQSKSGKELDIYEMREVGFYRLTKGQALAGIPAQPKMERVKVGAHKSLEENLRILLQKGRSAGYRICAATQRASTKVITGDAKANFPVQICFRVPKEIDSRVVIDEAGAESLAGAGDGLIRSPEYPDLVRFQAYFKP